MALGIWKIFPRPHIQQAATVRNSVKACLNPRYRVGCLVGSNGHVASRAVTVEALLPSDTSYDFE